MNSGDSESTPEEVHHGHSLESGVLERLREWTDVFPWIRLGRTLRVAGSPPLVLLVAVAFGIWLTVHVKLLGYPKTFRLGGGSTAGDSSLLADLWTIIASFVYQWMPTSIFALGEDESIWIRLLAIGWFLLIWTPVALLLARQGALLTAGRTMMGVKPVASHAARRTPSAWLAGIVPAACVLMIGLMILVVGWAGRLVDGVRWLEIPLAILAGLVAILCGVLAFGASAAVPLSWAAIANERDPDTLDSLSRGYEYLFRRPLRLVMYGVISIVILCVVAGLSVGVAEAAESVAVLMLGLAGAPVTLIDTLGELLRLLPIVVVVTMAWSLVGGVYLLLRYDAGGQEVEDLWEPAPRPEPPLPQLPPQTAAIDVPTD